MKYVPWSKSGVATIRKCPEKADLHKNRGIESIGNIYANKGKEVHRLKEMVDTGQIAPGDIRQHANDPDVLAWAELALLHDPYHGYRNRVCETHVMVDAEGNWVESEEEATAHGYLDDVIFPEEPILEVVDLKSGTAIHDDIVERHLYAGVLAKAAQPDYDRIRFTRFYCRTGKRPSWLYEWVKKKDGTALFVTDPKGERKQIRHKHPTNPLVIWMQKITQEIARTPAKPKPGSHCRNWFGTPCQFYGNLCSISDQIPDLVPAKPVISSPHKTSFLNFFRAKNRDEFLSLSAEDASLAFEAVQQLEAGTKDVEKKLKEWSATNGTIQVYDEIYGWRQQDEFRIDKAEALKLLYDTGLHWEEIAKAVSITKSSIEKLPKNMQSIKTLLLNICQSIPKNRFGVINEQ